MLNEMNGNRYLVQALLAEFKEENCEIHNYNELMSEGEPKVIEGQDDDAEERPSESSYDWDNLTDAEDEENCVEATRVLRSYIETVSGDERFKELTTLFEKEFPVSKLFSDKTDPRSRIQEISRVNNIPFETIRSDGKYVKMGCKHFGSYRTGKQTEEGNVE